MKHSISKLVPCFALSLFALSAYATNYDYTETETEDISSGVIATKYEYNSATGEFEKVYYLVGFDTLSATADTDSDVDYTWKTYTIGFSTEALTEKTARNTLEDDNNTSDGIYYYYSHDVTTNGALNVTGEITGITGVFTDNKTISTSTANIVGGGAIYTTSAIGTVNGVFINNSTTGDRCGGAIAVASGGSIDNLYGIFIGNSTGSTDALGGGAIYNFGDITNIEANFISNSSKKNGGAIYNGGSIGRIDGDFISNTATNNGGVIFNGGSIGTIDGDFISNTATNNGGVIFNNTESGGIDSIKGDFISNTALSGGAIQNYKGYITSIVGSFIGNSATSGNGGAINMTVDSIGSNSSIGSIQGAFMDNSAAGLGGAVYVTSGTSVGFVANTGDTTFVGNKDSTGSNAIYNAGTVTFDAYGDYSIKVYDGISGSSGTIDINSTIQKGSDFSTVGFYNTVANQTITVYAGTLALGSVVIDGTGYSANLSSSSLTVSSGATLSFVVSPSGNSSVNSSVNSITLGSLANVSPANVALDLSSVFGEFTLTINLLAADVSGFYESLTADDYLYLIFGDSTYETEAGSEYAYAVVSEGETLAGFDISYTDTSITIKGVSNVAVPEPSTYAMIIGALALGFAYYRRRKN